MFYNVQISANCKKMILKLFILSVVLNGIGNILSITSDKGNNALNIHKIYKNILMFEFNQECTNGLSTSVCTYLAFSINLWTLISKSPALIDKSEWVSSSNNLKCITVYL